MRQLSPPSNLVLAVLASLGLLGSLTLDWFHAPVTDPTITDGPVEQAAFQVSKVFSATDGLVTGNDAVGDGKKLLLALAVLVVVLAAAICIPAVRKPAEDIMRMVALAIPVLFVVVAFAHPGTDTPVTLHSGLLVGFIAALLTSSAAWHGATMRTKKLPPVRPRYGTTAP